MPDTTKILPLPAENDATGTGVPATNVADLNFSLLLEGSRLMLNTVDAYTEDELLDKVASTDMLQSRYEFILHMINHNTYHRGQIVTMCRRLGVLDNVPAMDYEAFLLSPPGTNVPNSIQPSSTSN
jgi:DinB family